MSETASTVARPSPTTRLGDRATNAIVTRLGRYGLLVVLAVVVGGFSLWIPDRFPTWGNFQDIVTTQPPSVFIALAAMVTLTVREFDLSLGANVGICQYIIMDFTVNSHMSWPLAVVIVTLIGLAIGAFNAFFVVRLGLNSFIVTIGMSTILQGLLEWISNGGAPIYGGAPHGLLSFGGMKVLGLTLPVFYALAAALLLWVMLEHTVFGRHLRATGTNAVAARLSGLPTRRSVVSAFMIAGALCGFAGVLASARIGAADTTSGPAYLLPAFAAAFLGATAIRPGFFNVWGTVIAIFVVAVGITGLQLEGMASWVTPVFNGVVLLIAITVSRLAANRAPRLRRSVA